MSLTTLGMNLSKLNNMASLNVSINPNPDHIITDIINRSNYYSNDLISYFILITLVVIVYLILTDKTQFGDFGYSDARGIGIAFAISTIIILTEMQSGFINNFLAVSFSTFMFLLAFIFILMYENKE